MFERLYAELKSLARRQSRRHGSGDVQTTTLVPEAFLKFKGAGSLQLEDRRYFLTYASRMMRSIIVDHARQRLAVKRGAGDVPVTLDTNIADSAAAATTRKCSARTKRWRSSVHRTNGSVSGGAELLRRPVERGNYGRDGCQRAHGATLLGAGAPVLQREPAERQDTALKAPARPPPIWPPHALACLTIHP